MSPYTYTDCLVLKNATGFSVILSKLFKGLRNIVRNERQEGNFTDLVTSKEVFSLVVNLETGNCKLNILKMELSTEEIDNVGHPLVSGVCRVY